jgi:N-acetylglucosaminyl-diphospho-decaprenol L-rhamnosyltransferase
VKLRVPLLNWRTAQMTVRALDALVPELRALGDARVLVVDNDSQDGSYDALVQAVNERGYGDVAEVVQSGRNGGYGFGNNVALRRGTAEGADYLYLLNSDAFVEPGAVRALVDYLDAHPRVGIAGSAVHSLDGAPHESAFRFPSVLSELERVTRLGVLTRALQNVRVPIARPTHTTTNVDWVAGASMMIRREVLEQIGLFDERFFLYYEETDLCLRAKRAGWLVAYVCESRVAHVGGASTGVTSQRVVQKPLPRYVLESRRHYFLKNHGRSRLWAANLAHFVGGASFRVRRVVQRKPDPERPREWLDTVLFNLTHS